MELTKDTLFVGFTDPVMKKNFFSDPIEYNVELGLFCSPDILNGPWRRTVSNVKKVFQKYPVKRHLHGPFYGLQYDCKDPEITFLAKKKIERVLTIAGKLQAEHIVVHSTFDPLNPDPRYREMWLERSTDFWKSLIPIAQKNNSMVVIENIYDKTPENLIALINAVDSPFFKGCLDVGHANIFGTISLVDWLEDFKKELFHLHLHDNMGATDDHLGLGEGNIDFNSFFSALGNIRHLPACTLEVLDKEQLEKSIAFLKNMGVWRL